MNRGIRIIPASWASNRVVCSRPKSSVCVCNCVRRRRWRQGSVSNFSVNGIRFCIPLRIQTDISTSRLLPVFVSNSDAFAVPPYICPDANNALQHPTPSNPITIPLLFSQQPLPSKLNLPRRLTSLKPSFRYAYLRAFAEFKFIFLCRKGARTVVREGDAGEGGGAEVVCAVCLCLLALVSDGVK